jgi:hypothetical protein
MSKKKAKETPPLEAKQKPKQQEQPKQQQPTQKPKPKNPVVRRTTYEYFLKFDPKPRRKSWIKETIEIAKKEPVVVTNLTRGQIMALINQVNKHNMTSDNKIAYKYSVKMGTVLLAPKHGIIATLKEQGKGEQ